MEVEAEGVRTKTVCHRDAAVAAKRVTVRAYADSEAA
jgi:hypothetical protein